VSPHMARWFNENLCNPTLELLEGQHHGSIMVEKRREILDVAIRALAV